MGLMAGIKLGGVAAVGGSILGYSGAKVISQHRELRPGVIKYIPTEISTKLQLKYKVTALFCALHSKHKKYMPPLQTFKIIRFKRISSYKLSIPGGRILFYGLKVLIFCYECILQ